MAKQFDRSAEDLGNIVGLEHVNLLVPDQGLATLFYVSGLGLTRDPYLMTSVDNMWINVGRSQFHLPTGKAQTLRGRTGAGDPRSRAAGEAAGERDEGARAARSSPSPSTTTRSRRPARGATGSSSTSPSERFAGMKLGMPYVEFDVPAGTAKGIADFYREVLRAPWPSREGQMPRRTSRSGTAQELVFRETEAKLADYDGHHIQVYVANFSQPHKRSWSSARSSPRRATSTSTASTTSSISASGKKLFEIEHEIRSMTHPLYARPLVNRNPRQTNRNYVQGRDGWVQELEDADMGDIRREMRQKRYEEATGRPLAAD